MITLYTMERDYPYGTLRSTNGCKVKVVLEEKSIDYQVVGVRPGDVWKKVPEVLEKHPLGKVPWIDDGETTVYDSTVINEYLNEKVVAPQLLPDDLALRGKARALENYADEGVLSKLLPMIWMPWWSPLEQRDQDAMQKGRDGLIAEILPFLEQTLGGQEYLCGDFSLADVPMMSVAMVLEVDGMDTSAFGNVHDYFGRLRGRSSYQAISPKNNCAETAALSGRGS
ncbi:MAG: glutathione S-transferase family protein [Pseudomonadales bacterium]|jgi:glutathione S-transferase|nr:glutathione S-transferase family protein [Pseudomonadales bacterium]